MSARILHDSARFVLFTKKTRIVQKSTLLYKIVQPIKYIITLKINTKTKNIKKSARLHDLKALFYAGHLPNCK